MITLHIGPMGSGKSAALINLYHLKALQKHRVTAVKPYLKEESNEISSRNGQSIIANLIPTTGEITTEFDTDKFDTIIIDEAHFFTGNDFIHWITNLKQNKNIHIGMLDTDYMTEQFETYKALLPLIDHEIYYKRRCQICNNKMADYTMRTKGGNSRFEVGKNLYICACKDCYKPFTPTE